VHVTVRFGLYLPTFGPLADPAALVELARRAEAAGWDGVFLWEHVLADGPVAVSDPWVTLGAMATATSRVLLGTMVSPLPRRRPWVLARQAGTLSRLSGGRCVLGVGLGADEYGDFSRFGEPTGLGTRAAMADQALDIISAVWAGSAHVSAGHYDVDLPAGEPEPHHIPVWVAATMPEVRSAHRAARSDGAVLQGPTTPEHVRQAVDMLRAKGSRRLEIVLTGNASMAWEKPNPDGTDIGALADAGMTWWLESLIHFDPLDMTMDVVDAGPAVSPR
jgi:alkanesulfonate monooxygenase SsuD/methylene tetrahydromethanopterin reductase-like flavin-dependent oxidoreductase (luciferase family)